jgi:hypothetical protein
MVSVPGIVPGIELWLVSPELPGIRNTLRTIVLFRIRSGSRIRQVSWPERIRNLPNGNHHLSHDDLGVHSVRDLRRRGMLKK